MNLRVLVEGILVLAFSLAAAAEGLRLILYKDPYVLYDPLGPGVYILALSLGLMVAGVVHFAVNYRKVSPVAAAAATKEMRIQFLSSTGILALYVLLVGFVGYLVATVTFFLLELRVAGVRSWRTSILLTLILTATYYVIFVKLCDLSFPKGYFFE